MRTTTLLLVLSISLLALSGCANKKTRVFGKDMPTMATIHAEKFNTDAVDKLEKPTRLPEKERLNSDSEFQWLPNPTLHMYVFKHLTTDGHPVPGYSTFFKMYRRDVIAEPSELGGWK